MDELELGIVRWAGYSWERSGPEDTDGPDDWMDCAHTSGRRLDRLQGHRVDGSRSDGTGMQQKDKLEPKIVQWARGS
jgi:hypothetical protein